MEKMDASMKRGSAELAVLSLLSNDIRNVPMLTTLEMSPFSAFILPSHNVRRSFVEATPAASP